MDTADGALLYPGGVGHVGDCPNDRIGGTVVRLGVVGLGIVRRVNIWGIELIFVRFILMLKCSLGTTPGQPSPRTAGANGGSIRVPGAKKIIFFKIVPRPLGMLKQVFLGRFEPMVTRTSGHFV